MVFSFFTKKSTTKSVQKTPSFGFKLPKQSPAPADNFLLKEKETKEWIESLPVANVGETARRIFKALINFNRMEMSFSQRLKTIECFKESIAFVHSNLEKHYYNIGMPLGPKSHKISVLSKELNSEMAIAYKIIINDIVTSNKKTFNSKILIIALHRALEYMSELIYSTSYVYEDIPNGIWHDIHHIYSYADDNGIINATVKSVIYKEKRSIQSIYINLNMFMAISPSRLRAKEMSLLIESLPKWIEYFSLDTKREFKDKTGRFIIDTLSDDPAISANILNINEVHRYRVLNTRPLIRYLHHYRHHKATKKTWMSELSPSLIDQLVKSLSYGAKREVERTQFHFELHLVVSLGSLFNHLPHYQPGDTNLTEDERLFFEQNSKFDFKHNLTPDSATSNEISDFHAPPSFDAPSLLTTDSVFQSTPAFNDSEKAQKIELDNVFVCKTLNESTGGYCVSWQGEKSPIIKVGEVLGIQAATDKSQFGVAIIRWIHRSHDKGLLVGIQLISSSVVAGEITDLDSKNTSTNHRAILLPPMRILKHKESIIFSPLPTQKGAKFSLSTKIGINTIQLGKRLEANGAFVQFYYDLIDNPESTDNESSEKKTKSKNKKTTEEKTDKFDNLWGSI